MSNEYWNILNLMGIIVYYTKNYDASKLRPTPVYCL